MRILSFIIANFTVLLTLNANELPQQDNKEHLGVASCAASMCHGSVIPREGSDVLQNEYIIWSRADAHSQAFQTLLSPESKKIANKLGLESATTASICLDCHSDNVNPDQQGEKFQLSDGVGCEACHGGAEEYITSHTHAAISRDENIAKGLYPTDKPKARAQLCLSCHLGNKDKQASHDIMGAGHPRLAFELDTFGILQPLHYVVDEDYLKQKWAGNNYITWIYGQLEASRATLDLLEEKLIDNYTLFPELSLFDCHSCHHNMSDLKWNENKGQGFKPGSVRLNDGNFKMLMIIASSTGHSEILHQNLADVKSSLNDKRKLKALINAIFKDIDQLEKAIMAKSIADKKVSAYATLNDILRAGSNGEFSDYIAAEQVVMAIDLLFEFIAKKPEFEEDISLLFDLVANDEKFNDALFSKQLSKMYERIRQ